MLSFFFAVLIQVSFFKTYFLFKFYKIMRILINPCEFRSNQFNKRIPADIYLFKVNYRSTRKRCEICPKLTKKQQNDVRDVIFLFWLLTLNIFHFFSGVSIIDSEQINVSWDSMEVLSPRIYGTSYKNQLKIGLYIFSYVVTHLLKYI